MTGRRIAGASLVALAAAWGCTDDIPTSGNENLIPVEAATYELLLPFSEFVSDFQVWGGFSSAARLGSPPVAHRYREDLEARTLVGFGRLPAQVFVLPPGETTTRPDSQYVATGGTLLIRMDTVSYAEGTTIDVAVSSVQERWDPDTAGWTHAIDTLGNRVEWTEPGGGELREVGVVSWDPLDGDSIVVELDSLTAQEWSDRDSPLRTALIESRTPGALLAFRSATFRPEVRSDINPDTLIALSAEVNRRTFVHSPETGTSLEEIRIGGAPSRRAYLRVEPPLRIEEGSPHCVAVPCPVELVPDRVVYAGLVLETKPTEPVAFQPLSTFRLGARPALAPELIPRSPLGSQVQPDFRQVAAGAFAGDGRQRVEIPMTRYVQDILRALAEGAEVPNMLALFAATEPNGFQYATFRAPGDEGEPHLRIILTLSEGVRAP